jgi:hypothetical protein
MPHLTEHQEATRNLLKAYVAHTLAVIEADATHVDDARDYESEEDDSDSSLLDVYHYDFSNIFRSFFHVTPDCFNNLVAAVSNHPVFYNNSNHEQIPIKDQAEWPGVAWNGPRSYIAK